MDTEAGFPITTTKRALLAGVNQLYLAASHRLIHRYALIYQFYLSAKVIGDMLKKVFFATLIGLSSLANAASVDDLAVPLPNTMDKQLIDKIVADSIKRQSDSIEAIKSWPDTRLSDELTARLKDRTAIFFSQVMEFMLNSRAAMGLFLCGIPAIVASCMARGPWWQ